jgi:hypothetical protein
MIYKAKCFTTPADRLEVENLDGLLSVAVWQDRTCSGMHLTPAESLRLAEALLKNYRKVVTP